MSETMTPEEMRKMAGLLRGVVDNFAKSRLVLLERIRKSDTTTAAVVEVLCLTQLECTDLLASAILDGFATLAERMAGDG